MQKHRWWRPLLWAGLLAFGLLLAWQVVTSRALLAADVIALGDSWRFVDESKPGAPLAMGELTVAATDAPAQVAARFNIQSTMQALALQLSDAELGGLPLAQVEELGYCTRLVDGPRPFAVTLQINLDADVTDGDDSWQGRLVYTPSYNGAVIQGEWQCWNTLVGKWWATGGPLAAYAPVTSPQPLGTLLARFPQLGINDTYSVVTLKAGDGWSNFQGEASPVVIGVEGERINIAFGTASQDVMEETELLLPVLFNQPSVVLEPVAWRQNDYKVGKQQEKEERKQERDDQKKKNWRAVDWDKIDLADFDWDSIDWDKVDWKYFDWDAFGLHGVDRAEAIGSFVDDVKQCKYRGWEEMGFNTPGDCVAYYLQAHSSATFRQGNFESRRDPNNRGDGDDRNGSGWRDDHGDDD